MPLPRALHTVGDITVARPSGKRLGGGDQVATVLHAGLSGRVSVQEEFIRDPVGQAVERRLRTLIRLPARDREYQPVDVQGRDIITYPDYRGIRQAVEVTVVWPVYNALGRLESLRVEAKPVGE